MLCSKSGAFFLQKFAQILLLKKYGQKSNAFLTDLDMDTSAYSSNWSVFYTGATQFAEIRKNAFRTLGGFLEKIVVKTRRLLQPCTGCYTQFWNILAKQMAKAADLRHTIRAQVAPYTKHIEHTQKPPIRTTNSTETRLFVQFRQRHNNVIRSHAATNAFFNKNTIKNEKSTCIRI